MSYRFAFKPKQALVLIEFEGAISPEEEFAAFTAVVEDQRLKPDSATPRSA